MYSRISGTGSYLPEKILTNHDLEKMVDTSDEWIVERTGIKKRHIAEEGETTCDLAEIAVRRAMEMAGKKAEDIDLIVFATTTPDLVFPSTACLLQKRLGITGGGAAFDVQAVCTGFVYALGLLISLSKVVLTNVRLLSAQKHSPIYWTGQIEAPASYLQMVLALLF